MRVIYSEKYMIMECIIIYLLGTVYQKYELVMASSIMYVLWEFISQRKNLIVLLV